MSDINKAYSLTIGANTWVVDCPRLEHSGSATIQPNTYNSFGSVSGTLTITKGTDKPNVANNYMVRLTATAGVTIVFEGFDLVWYGGYAPTWDDGTTYEISIIDNMAIYTEFK